MVTFKVEGKWLQRSKMTFIRLSGCGRFRIFQVYYSSHLNSEADGWGWVLVDLLKGRKIEGLGSLIQAKEMAAQIS